MSTNENIQNIIAELDDAQSLVEHLQERVAALEDENSRQRREFLEFRTSTERALGNSSISRQRRLLAARRAPPLPNSVGTLEVELDEEEERPSATPPPQTPPCGFPLPPRQHLRVLLSRLSGEKIRKGVREIFTVSSARKETTLPSLPTSTTKAQRSRSEFIPCPRHHTRAVMIPAVNLTTKLVTARVRGLEIGRALL